MTKSSNALLDLYEQIAQEKSGEDQLVEISAASQPEVLEPPHHANIKSHSFTEQIPTSSNLQNNAHPHRTGQHQQLKGEHGYRTISIELTSWEAERLETLFNRIVSARPTWNRDEILKRLLMLGVQNIEYSFDYLMHAPKRSVF